MRLRSLHPLIVVFVILLVVGFAWGFSYPGHTSSGTGGRSSSPIASPLSLQATSPSWNPASNCKAVVLTMEQFVGSVPNPSQGTPSVGAPVGADYSGGALPLEGATTPGTNPPSSNWPYTKRAINPPCSVTLANGTVLPTLVEIHNVQVEGTSCDELGAVYPNICDWTYNVCNNQLAVDCHHTATYPDTMHKFHAEIDMNWTYYKLAPPVPTTGYQVDVQGFAFWDDGHVNEGDHSYSGWELHPLSAWRITNSTGSKTVNMAASPTNIGPVGTGSPGNSTITVTSVNGFTGIITLSALAPYSSGTVASVSYVAASCNPTSVTLTSGSRASSLCSFNPSQPGSFELMVLGSNSSNPTSSVTMQLGAIPDFTLSANPTSVTVNARSPGTSTITLAGLGGFAGVVNLFTNSPSCSVTPTSLTGSGSSTLSCTFASAELVQVAVTGTSGSLSHSATVNFIVQDFTIAANPTSVTVNAGSPGTSTITVTGLNGFAAVVNLASNSTACTLTPTSVTGSGSSTLSCTFATASTIHVTVTGTSASLSHSTTVMFIVQDFTITANPASVTVLLGSPGTSSITVTGLNGFAGVVNLASNSTACTLTPASVTGSGSSTLSCTFASAGIVHITVTGTSASLSHSVTVTYTIQDFAVTANPTTVRVNAGSPGTSSITVAALQGFSGVVNLASNSTACTLTPASVTGSGSSTLSCTFAAASTIHVTVTGTTGSSSHSATVTFIVQDFTIAANPTSVTLNAGSPGTSTITVTGLNGFAGVVNLAGNSTACTLTPASVTGSGSSILSCTFATASTIHATVTGTSASLSHSTTVTFTVQDFNITANPSLITSTLGSAPNSTITMSSLVVFSRNVNLTAIVQCSNTSGSGGGGGGHALEMAPLPSCPTLLLNPPSVFVPTGGSVLSILTVNGSSTPAGNYLVNVTGTSGNLVHSVLVNVTFTNSAVVPQATPLAADSGSNGTYIVGVWGFAFEMIGLLFPLLVLIGTVGPRTKLTRNVVHDSFKRHQNNRNAYCLVPVPNLGYVQIWKPSRDS